MRTLKTAAVGLALLGGSLAISACGTEGDTGVEDPVVTEDGVTEEAPVEEAPADENADADTEDEVETAS